MNEVFEGGKIDEVVRKHGHMISLVSVLISVSVVLSAVYTTKYIIEANDKNIRQVQSDIRELRDNSAKIRLTEIEANEARSLLNASSIQSLNYKFRLLEERTNANKK